MRLLEGPVLLVLRHQRAGRVVFYLVVTTSDSEA